MSLSEQLVPDIKCIIFIKNCPLSLLKRVSIYSVSKKIKLKLIKTRTSSCSPSSVLQLFASFGLLNDQFLFIPTFSLFFPMTGFHNFSIILYVIFPPHFGSSTLGLKTTSFHSVVFLVSRSSLLLKALSSDPSSTLSHWSIRRGLNTTQKP